MLIWINMLLLLPVLCLSNGNLLPFPGTSLHLPPHRNPGGCVSIRGQNRFIEQCIQRGLPACRPGDLWFVVLRYLFGLSLEKGPPTGTRGCIAENCATFGRLFLVRQTVFAILPSPCLSIWLTNHINFVR